MKTPVLALPFLFLTACFVGRTSDNEPLNRAAVAELKPGATTAREVVDILGAPADVVQLGRRSAYLYRHTVEKKAGLLLILVGLYNEDVRSDRLWVFFDEHGVLTHHGATLAAERAQRAMPWDDIHGEQKEPQPDPAERTEKS
jgi:outer membrane protein assembly factor BamE (lipoprotein component of BamABCDE complex)